MGPTGTPSSPSVNSYGSDGYHSDYDQYADECDPELIQQYRRLYLKDRANILQVLDSLVQLKHAHYLKIKILFSIIVVSIIFYFNFIFNSSTNKTTGKPTSTNSIE